MIEFNNQEDQNIWSCLEDFDFSEYPDVSKLRIELYLSIMKSIGTCSRCVNFDKSASFCRLLSFSTASFERCSDFSPVEQEDEGAFEIMSEEFRREQENLNNFSRIRKYQRMPRKPHKEEKTDVSKDRE
jgi:hypothetical protein